MSKPHLRDMLRKKEVDPHKDAKLEKGDFLALLLAASSVFLPVLLLAIGVLALFILGWLAFFHGL